MPTPAINNSPENFYTSVLGIVDYRYGTDSALVNSDIPCTNFQCNTQILSPIPNDINNGLTDHFISTNNFISPIWTSSNGQSFVTGVGVTSITLEQNQNNFTYIKAVGTPLIGVPFLGATPILNYIFALVYVDGVAGNVIQYNGSPAIVATNTSFTCDGAIINYPSGINHLYLVYADFHLGQLWVIDFYTRVATGRTTNFTPIVPTTALQLLDVTSSTGIVDMASYFNCNNINNVLNYFYTTYGGSFLLPLTFPANAVATTN